MHVSMIENIKQFVIKKTNTTNLHNKKQLLIKSSISHRIVPKWTTNTCSVSSDDDEFGRNLKISYLLWAYFIIFTSVLYLTYFSYGDYKFKELKIYLSFFVYAYQNLCCELVITKRSHTIKIKTFKTNVS